VRRVMQIADCLLLFVKHCTCFIRPHSGASLLKLDAFPRLASGATFYGICGNGVVLLRLVQCRRFLGSHPNDKTGRWGPRYLTPATPAIRATRRWGPRYGLI